MALTLRAAITADQTTIDLLGADELADGEVYSIGSEYLEVRGEPFSPAGTNYQRATFYRHVQGTPRAAHAAAAELTNVQPGSGGGAVTATLAEVLAAGADAGSVPIENFKAEAITDQFDATGNAGEVATADGAGTWGWQAPGAAPTPNLAAVLASGAFPGGIPIEGAAVADEAGGKVTIWDAAALQGGAVEIKGGSASSPGSAPGDVILIGGVSGIGDGGQIAVSGGSAAAGQTGGAASIGGGGNGGGIAANLFLPGASVGFGSGIATLTTDGVTGAAGQFVGSNGSNGVKFLTPLVRHAAGVPSGAPGVGELPIAFDSTAVTGGLYFWDGAAWVKVSVIP